MKGYKPPKVKDEEGAAEAAVDMTATTREPLLPEMDQVANLMTKDGTDSYRQDQLEEIYSIQKRLAQDGQQICLKTLQKAFLLPEEPCRKPSAFIHPSPMLDLMKSPFAKPEKKKKKKKR